MSNSKVLEAENAFRRADLPLTERLCDEILSQVPNSAPATLLKGLCAMKKHRLGEAIELLLEALKLSPNDYVATTWLIGAYYEGGRYADAISLGQKARAVWPNDVDVLIGLGHALMMGVQDVEGSIDCLRAAVHIQPKNASLRCKLGAAYESQAKDHEAHCEYLAAIDADSHFEEAYSRLARLFMGHGNYVEALDFSERGLRALPRSGQMHLLHAQSLRHLREFDKANEALLKAIALDPNITVAAAKWLEEDGRFEEAEALYKRAIDTESNLGTAYYGIVRSREMKQEDKPMIERIEGLLDKQLSLREAASVHYALGKAANDLGDYEKAMKHFDEGNTVNYRLHLSGKPYNAQDIAKWRSQTMAISSLETMERYSHLGSDSDLPIFIIGMIRSGTTLTEQILSAHPNVEGAGEQRFWLAEAPGLIDLDLQTIDEASFVEARDRYLDVLRSLNPGAKRITDKMPMNYFVVWLIHLAFPNAKIIHVRRSPIDTALSIYMTDLAKPPDFAHSKKNIVAGYRDYEILMEHFADVIPEDRLMAVQYEDLIDQPEVLTRRMLSFCDLPWDPRCLEFYSSERQVSTPSRWQVRQPIYRTSVEKWRRYEPWLGEFEELLK